MSRRSAAFDDQIVPANKANGEPRVLVTPAFYRVPAYRKFHGSDGATVSLRGGTSRAAFLRQASALAASPQYKSSTGGQIFIGDLDAQAAATERAIQPEVIALVLFALLAGLITFAVMSQLMGRQVVLDATENPVLRAIGMKRRDLFILSLMRAGVVTISGAVGAVLVAIAASPSMPIGPARLAEPAPGIDLNLTVLGFGLVVAAFLPLVALIPSAWRASAYGLQGARATRGGRSGSLVVRMASSVGSVPASFGIRMALEPGSGRNAVPVRSALVGITIAVTAVVATLVFGASLLHLVDTPTLYGQNWDREVDLSFGSVPGPFARQVLSHQPGMTSFALGNYAPFGTVSIGGEAVPAIGIGHASGRSFLTMLSGGPPSGSHEVVLGARTLQSLRRHVGNTVPVEINGHIRAMRIVGTAVFASFSRGSFDATDLGDGAAFSASVMSTNDQGTDCVGNVTCYNFFLVRYRPGTNLVAAGARLEKAVVAAGCPVGSCNIVADQRPDDINDYSRVRETPVLLAGVLAVLAIAMLAHVLVTGIRRHRRDLAVLKTLGLLRRQMLAMIAWDASTIAAVTLALGIPLGIVAGRISWSLFADSVGVPVDVEVPLLSVLLIVPVTLAIANVTAAWPGWLAGRVSAATILRDE